MQIVIGQSASLAAADDFTAFDVRAGDAGTALAALGDGGAAAPEADHVFVTVDAVRRLASEALGELSESWEDGFAKMLAYAGSKGWMNEDGTAIKAHLSS